MSRAFSRPSYGRKLGDFTPGDVYAHPWDVTVDDGMIALFSSAFQDATPVFASRAYARAVGFHDRPVHPLLLLNLGLSFSVHDVSEQAIAHLAYIDVRFPEPCYAGDSVTASSRVLDVKPSSKGDRGVVEVRTVLESDRGHVVCRFDRKALVRAGMVEARPVNAWPRATQPEGEVPSLPAALRGELKPAARSAGFAGFFEDFAVGDQLSHGVGKTVGESEHMLMTQLCRNSHPIHFDEAYCKENSFAKTRVVYGGLVLSWVLALTSRDLSGNGLWDAGLDEGAHPNGVVAGDTLYASSKVLAKEDHGPNAGILTLRVVGTKNRPGAELDPTGANLFTPELTKKDGKMPDKVVEITRKLLLRKRPAR
ncbi:MAG: MaoC family dehydratase [Sorangiineae bacterium]|nr:MaoC family dehydratase [Polyangiaceae bacterium]MEB2323994.1 MaoC family dehydratase [Sorangiineae bacterium]